MCPVCLQMLEQQQRAALSWADDGAEDETLQLKIVVLTNVFAPDEFAIDPSAGPGSEAELAMKEEVAELQTDILGECMKLGPVEKVTVFPHRPEGAVVIKFKKGFAAKACVDKMNGRFLGGRKLKCEFWDGVTNYSEGYAIARLRPPAYAHRSCCAAAAGALVVLQSYHDTTFVRPPVCCSTTTGAVAAPSRNTQGRRPVAVAVAAATATAMVRMQMQTKSTGWTRLATGWRVALTRTMRTWLWQRSSVPRVACRFATARVGVGLQGATQ